MISNLETTKQIQSLQEKGVIERKIAQNNQPMLDLYNRYASTRRALYFRVSPLLLLIISIDISLTSSCSKISTYPISNLRWFKSKKSSFFFLCYFIILLLLLLLLLFSRQIIMMEVTNENKIE